MAGQLPPELLENLLKCLDTTAEFSKIHRQLSKHERGNCSLVCRYWAKKLRWRIFDSLRLCTREDALSFSHFFKAGCADLNIRQYVRELSLKQSVSECTWVHLVEFTLRSYPRLDGQQINISLIIRGDDHRASTLCPYRTIFGDLPRSLPSSCTHIRQLYMNHLHFWNAYEMLLYLESIPYSCEHIVCSSLSLEDGWDFTLSDIARSIDQFPRRRLRHVSIRDCNRHWSFLLLLLAKARQNPGHRIHSTVYVHETELSNLLSIVEAASIASGTLLESVYRSEFLSHISVPLIINDLISFHQKGWGLH
jgi:hypothetical protein